MPTFHDVNGLTFDNSPFQPARYVKSIGRSLIAPYAANIVVDGGLYSLVSMTLTGNATLSCPVNGVHGNKVEFHLYAPSGASLTLDPAIILPASSGVTSPISITAETVLVVQLAFDGVNNEWVLLGGAAVYAATTTTTTTTGA